MDFQDLSSTEIAIIAGAVLLGLILLVFVRRGSGRKTAPGTSGTEAGETSATELGQWDNFVTLLSSSIKDVSEHPVWQAIDARTGLSLTIRELQASIEKSVSLDDQDWIMQMAKYGHLSPIFRSLAWLKLLGPQISSPAFDRLVVDLDELAQATRLVFSGNGFEIETISLFDQVPEVSLDAIDVLRSDANRWTDVPEANRALETTLQSQTRNDQLVIDVLQWGYKIGGAIKQKTILVLYNPAEWKV